MANIPEVVQYGKVTGLFRAFLADAPEDDDSIPNAKPMEGTVTLTPSVTTMRLPTARCDPANQIRST